MFGITLPAIPSWALKAAGILLAVLAVLFAIHSWDKAIASHAVTAVQLQTAQTNLKVERKVATITTANALSEAKAQDIEKEKTRVVVQKVAHYFARAVPVDHPCVPWGLVRLHDAAAAGVDPSTVTAPPGQPDDACSTIEPGDLAATIAQNYGVARQNAEQLDALEADIRQRIDVANGTGDNQDGPH